MEHLNQEQELEFYVNQLKNIQEEINRLDAKRIELVKEGLKIEGIINYINQKLLQQKNKDVNG
ncbi:MAG: hypothetical protein QXD43_01600 [Candidatus Aenigmatarchaeota archaeon]